jgi:hypothetical protein
MIRGITKDNVVAKTATESKSFFILLILEFEANILF